MDEESRLLLCHVQARNINQVRKALSQGANINYVDESGNFPLKIAAANDDYHEITELLLDEGASVNLVDNEGKSALMIACGNGCSKISHLLCLHGAKTNHQDKQLRNTLMYLAANSQVSSTNVRKVVEILLQYGVNFDIKDAEGKSALMIACEEANHTAAEFLLAYGADPNLQDSRGQSALMKACENELADFVELLLKHKSQLDLQDSDGVTSLMRACEKGSKLITNLLISNKAQVNLQDEEGKSALIRACEMGQDECVEILLHNGAKTDLQDKDGKTALIRVCEQLLLGEGKITSCVQLLLDKGAQVDLQDNEGNSALITACELGESQCAKLLLSHRAQVDLQDRAGETALMRACGLGEVECAKLLLAYSAQVDLQSREEKTALFIACEEGEALSVRLLVSHEAKLNLTDSKGKTALMRACEKGNDDCVKEFTGATFDHQNRKGETALILACDNGNEECVKQLLIMEAKVINQQNKNGETALIRACVKGNIKCVSALVRNGASIDILDNQGQTALMRACDVGQDKCMQLLIQYGASIDLQNQAGKTALMKACSLGKVDCMELLLSSGAQVDLQDKEGKTALFIACAKGKASSVRLLLNSEAQPDLQDGKGKTALMQACEKGNDQCVKHLMNMGARVDLQTKTGETALMLACVKGNNKCVKMLLNNKGAFVDMQDSQGQTAVIRTCGSSHKTKLTTDLLIKSKAKLNIQDNEGSTALMHACEKGKHEDANLLLRNGAQIDWKDNDGETALMIASKSTNDTVLVTKLLLRNRAKVNLQDGRGRTALMTASETGKEEIVKLLLECGAQVDFQDEVGSSALMIASETEKQEIVEMLLSSGAQIDLQDNKGKTALMRACKRGQEENTRLLLNRGAQKDKQDSNGMTALIHACSSYWPDEDFKPVVDLLVANGAQIDCQDNMRMTALMWACLLQERSVSSLLNHGAQVNLQDDEGQTALMVACKYGAQESVSLLLNSGAKTDIQDNEGITALMRACEIDPSRISMKELYYESGGGAEDNEQEKSDIVKLLLSNEAQVNLQDKEGRTALIRACGWSFAALATKLQEKEVDDKILSSIYETARLETVKLLLQSGADSSIKDAAEQTALTVAYKNGWTKIVALLLSNEELEQEIWDVPERGKTQQNKPLLAMFKCKALYPGILFSEGAKRETVTVTEKAIDLEEAGLQLFIPEEAVLSTDPPLQLEIQPCFSGPFDVPKNVELVSPAYIVKPSREVSFRKEVLVKIWHHANLETEKDCEDMVFLSAKTTPEYWENSPVYVFREIKGAKGQFRPGEEQPVGKIALKHFCTLALGKRKRQDGESQENEPKHSKGNLYSARLYRAIENKLVFCICLYHPQYIKNCNEVMAAKYGNSDEIAEPTACFNGVEVTSNEVSLRHTCPSGWAVDFKKRPASILKKELHTQVIYDIFDVLQMDYPPKIEVAVQSVPNSPDAKPLCLHVEGLDNKAAFLIHKDDILPSRSTSKIECAMSDLKKEIQEQSSSSESVSTTLVSTASEMLIIMEQVECLLQSTSVLNLLSQLETKSQQLTEETSRILRLVKINFDMNVHAKRTNTLAVQMKTVYAANVMHRHTPEWQSALCLFIANAANLMQAIKDTLTASKLAQAIPNNFCMEICTPPLDIPSCQPSTPPPAPSPLSKDHTAEVCRCLYPLRARWKTIGTFLCIDHSSLESIKADNEDSADRLTELIAVWLRRHTPPPTWQALADAVQYIDPDKAQEIRLL